MIELQEIEVTKEDTTWWEVVPDSFRKTPRNVFAEDEIIKALTDGKTVRIKDPKRRVDNLYRWARANNYKMHRKHFKTFQIAWIDREETTD